MPGQLLKGGVLVPELELGDVERLGALTPPFDSLFDLHGSDGRGGDVAPFTWGQQLAVGSEELAEVAEADAGQFGYDLVGRDFRAG